MTDSKALKLLQEGNQQALEWFVDHYSNYVVDGTNTKVYIDYYDTGEIYYLDASELYPFDYAPYEFPHDYLEAKFPDKEALRIQLIEMVPGIVDDLHEDGWIKHSSKDIFKADILPEQTIWVACQKFLLTCTLRTALCCSQGGDYNDD